MPYAWQAISRFAITSAINDLKSGQPKLLVARKRKFGF